MAKPQIFKHPESAPRVSLGRMVVPEPEHDELILTFGKRDSGTRGGLSVVGGTAKSVLTSEERRLNAEISTALANVRSHSLPKQEGPYADTDDAVLEMAKALAVHANRLEDLVVIATDILRPRGTDQEGEMAERQIRRTLNNPDYMFVVDPSYIPSSLPTAGALLTEPERLSNDDLSGAQERILTHPFEVITLTIACLREIATLKGFKGEIFPAFANSRNPENPDEILHIPVVAVLDQAAEFPLRTFGVGPVHPPVGSFDILSDQAVLGFQHGLLAHNRVRAMCKDIADKLENHEPLPSTDEIDAVALEEIGRASCRERV